MGCLRTPWAISMRKDPRGFCLCYTPEELERKRAEHGIVSLAAEQGIALEA